MAFRFMTLEEVAIERRKATDERGLESCREWLRRKGIRVRDGRVIRAQVEAVFEREARIGFRAQDLRLRDRPARCPPASTRRRSTGGVEGDATAALQRGLSLAAHPQRQAGERARSHAPPRIAKTHRD